MDEILTPDYIEINRTGGASRTGSSRPLADNATVQISGAKNEVLGAMCAAILTDEPVIFNNVPFITDVLDMCEIMREIGVKIEYNPQQRQLKLHAKKILTNTLPDNALNFRASYYIWGAILARFQKTGEFKSLKIKIPGGDVFGGIRAINYHTDLIKNIFGADLIESADNLEFVIPEKLASAPAASAAPTECPIYSTLQVSHGATFHWLLSVALSSHLKMMYNASLEFEVAHLVGILNKMGATIRGTNTTAITNLGFNGHLLKGGEFDILPDRMETGFYALLAMALKSKIKLLGTDAPSCRPWLNSVIEIAGTACCRIENDSMTFDFTKLSEFDGRNYIMSPIPGKETDMQQLWTPILATARTPSKIYDPVWAGRIGHLPEMEKFGLKLEHRTVRINNSVALQAAEITIHPSRLHAANVTGMDIRGTAGLIICAVMASGSTSRINNPKFALRGYPNLIQNLKNIGIDVK